MRSAKSQDSPSTIRFKAELAQLDIAEIGGLSALLTLPKNGSARLPSKGPIIIEATINGFPFRTALEPDGNGTYYLKLNKALQDAADAEIGDTVTVEITRIGQESEIRMPLDLRNALASDLRARALWTSITPTARRDWILWISSGRLSETRQIRIEKACSMLASGKRRVCCFGGLNWLRKDHPSAGETWLPLPNPKNSPLTSDH
jgi:hypothetical protein